MKTKHSGSCLCDQIKYEVVGSFDGFYLCHCTYCQKDTGSAHAANLVSASAKLTWTAGDDLVRTFTLPSTRHMKSFCQACGSAMPSLHMDGKMLVVPAGSLNTPIDIAATAHIFCASQASWEDGLVNAPRFDSFPG